MRLLLFVIAAPVAGVVLYALGLNWLNKSGWYRKGNKR
jgi:hypothetical protein